MGSQIITPGPAAQLLKNETRIFGETKIRADAALAGCLLPDA
jgi:hypothetical protein